MSKTCQVRIWRGDADRRCQYAGDCVAGCNKGCRIGCNRPARFKNPFFGKETPDEAHWWRNPYNYAEYLCAECYDNALSDLEEWEELYGEADPLEG